MQTLLVEIGSEEIPAGYINPALEAFSSILTKKLSDSRIEYGTVEVFGTPRRLAVEIEGVASMQFAATTEVMGPPEKAAFDADRKPTMAALKFAEKVGLAVDQIQIKETPKGNYLCATVQESARATQVILSELLPEIILSIPFPKTMRWAKGEIAFARPVISLLALLGSEVIPFSLGGLASGRITRGHSIMAPMEISLSSPAGYVQALKNAKVIPSFEERRALVLEDVTKAAASVGGKILPDEALLDLVANIVEYPAALAGTFDTAYLELPREILITSMREHQKYFAVVDDTGNLLPHFIAVNNTLVNDPDLVRKGHQRVLRARLEDARFFFKSDLAETFEHRIEKLHAVLFQAKLGSVHAKVERIQKLAAYLAGALCLDETSKAQALRAAALCKADLVSHVVGEFPNLQGIMGRVYALKAQEGPEVATAIEEHYRPVSSGSILPATLPGALVAIADKMDSICGCFHVGLIPTGAADPYALRRQSIGILQILLAQNISIPLGDIIAAGLALFEGTGNAVSPDTAGQVLSFFKTRLANLLSESGYSKEVIAAVIDTADQVPQTKARAMALEALKAQPDFEPLAVAFKRVVNIIKKADPQEGTGIDPSLFEHVAEGALLAQFEKVKAKASANLSDGKFDEALLAVASLRPAVDAFFEGVMVMAEDNRIRNNRLGLLRAIAELFALMADFSKL